MDDDAVPPEPPLETVEGLDPRALFARAAKRFDVSALLRVWEPPPVEEAARLLPQYEWLDFLGRGGMGAVYRARQPHLDRLVAIKLMPAEAAADEAFAARFRVEARALAKLQHANIVAIYDFGQTSEGHLFFVMEYVDGADLAQLIHSRALQPAQALEIASRVCEALQFAHERGIVHRDIKPGNILVDRSGRVKVADFGLAKLRPGAEVARSQPSMTGSIVGTPDYMAPEQLDGGEVDARADIYSLGVMLYEMLTGQLPRGAWEPPSRKAQTDSRLDGVVNKALQAEPARRYQQASEVRTDVDGIRTSSPRRKAPVLWWSAAAAALMLATAGWLILPPLFRQESQFAPDVSLPASKPDTILGQLDLRTATVSGEWFWKDNHPGETLAHAAVPPDRALLLSLPVHPAGRAYKLSFDLLLQEPRSNAGVILPAGDARTGLVLNLNNHSGLGLINGLRWDYNSTTTADKLPIGEKIPFVIKVGPYGDRTTIMVEARNRPFIRWDGPRRELSLFSDPKIGWNLTDPDALGFASYGGGLEISNVKFEFLSPLSRPP